MRKVLILVALVLGISAVAKADMSVYPGNDSSFKVTVNTIAITSYTVVQIDQNYGYREVWFYAGSISTGTAVYFDDTRLSTSTFATNVANNTAPNFYPNPGQPTMMYQNNYFMLSTNNPIQLRLGAGVSAVTMTYRIKRR